MILAKVIGTVVTTISHADFKHRRLLAVQPLTLPGEKAEGDFIALDNTNAGVGDTVLIIREGNGTRQVTNNPDGCVNSLIVGIIDSLYINPDDLPKAKKARS
jgi:microcompartment protein CcmK/EutM